MQIEWSWWIGAIEAPIAGGLFWLLHNLRRDLSERLERADARESAAVQQARADLAEFKLEVTRSYAPIAVEARGGRDARHELAEFKLEVARTYVPLSLIRDVDQRLSQQLLRIETKLEEVRRTGAEHPRATRERNHLENME